MAETQNDAAVKIQALQRGKATSAAMAKTDEPAEVASEEHALNDSKANSRRSSVKSSSSRKNSLKK